MSQLLNGFVSHLLKNSIKPLMCVILKNFVEE